MAYGTLAKSETVLARAIHLLTLGAYAWDDTAPSNAIDWRRNGGGTAGSIFHTHTSQPLPTDWITLFLLRDPQQLMNSTWYSGEENALLLLHRLAQSAGGGSGGHGSTPTFCTQDASIRNGARWLCEYAKGRHEGSKDILGKNMEERGAAAKAALGQDGTMGKVGESDLKRRGRIARERAMKRTQERMANFAKMFEEVGGTSVNDDTTEDKDTKPIISDNFPCPTPLGTKTSSAKIETSTKPLADDTASMATSLESDGSSTQRPIQMAESIILDASATRSASSSSSSSSSLQHELQPQLQTIQRRLLTSELRCIICDEDCQTTAPTTTTSKEEDKRRPSKSKPQDYYNNTAPAGKPATDKILAFCGYAQASTILKGGGGVPSSSSSSSSVSDLVGTHVSLCGHVMHTSCCESHLKDLTQRIDRFSDRVEGGKRGDFQCPMCRQLSNCLIPVISVGSDWIYKGDVAAIDNTSENNNNGEVRVDGNNYCVTPSLDSFLSTTKWWAARNDKSVIWNGRCAFLRKGVKPVGKKDLYIAWTIVMKSPRPFLRKRKGSPESSLSPSKHNQLSPSRNVSVHESGSPSNLSLLQQQHSTASHAVITPSTTSNQQISVVTDVWRRVMDQFADVSYKADLKRLGDTRLQGNYGEFRHYLVEKVVFNKVNRSAGINIVDVSVLHVHYSVLVVILHLV